MIGAEGEMIGAAVAAATVAQTTVMPQQMKKMMTKQRVNEKQHPACFQVQDNCTRFRGFAEGVGIQRATWAQGCALATNARQGHARLSRQRALTCFHLPQVEGIVKKT